MGAVRNYGLRSDINVKVTNRHLLMLSFLTICHQMSCLIWIT